MVKSQICNMADIFEGCTFVINYNTDKNLEQVQKIYRDNVPEERLIFTHDTEPNFAETTIRQVKKIKTDYTLFMCEDFVYPEGKECWSQTFREFVDKDLDFCMMAKIEKYSKPEWRKNYEEGNHLYTYHSSESPTNRGVVSIDAIYKTRNLLDMLLKLRVVKEIRMQNGSISKYVNMPNFYEQYFAGENGMLSLDWKCSVPKRLLAFSYHPEDQSERPW